MHSTFTHRFDSGVEDVLDRSAAFRSGEPWTHAHLVRVLEAERAEGREPRNGDDLLLLAAEVAGWEAVHVTENDGYEAHTVAFRCPCCSPE